MKIFSQLSAYAFPFLFFLIFILIYFPISSPPALLGCQQQ
jgi:hypothetical protein